MLLWCVLTMCGMEGQGRKRSAGRVQALQYSPPPTTSRPPRIHVTTTAQHQQGSDLPSFTDAEKELLKSTTIDLFSVNFYW